MGLIFLSLLVFTLFGEQMYAWGKPVVTLKSSSTSGGDGASRIPKEALLADEAGNFVYMLQSEQGYSRKIYTVIRVEVDVEEQTEFYDEEIELVRAKGVKLDRVVVHAEGALSDGCRVILR